ncbi:MAG TPA: phosphatidate cytidylyltransferase [Verrucomicrobiae bacterium]|nr:phosphatidate cytidylyltransferase [Verrucomicrobiae bacterium]
MAASEIRARAASAVILSVLVFGALVSGWDLAYATIIPMLGGLALWEFYAALENRGIHTFRRLGTTCGVFFLLASWAILSGRVTRIGQPLFEWISMLVLLLGLLTRQVFDRSQATPVITIAITILGTLYVAWLLNFVTHLIYFPPAGDNGRFLAIFLIVVTKMTDVGAYVVGRLFGRHKMMPILSPKKTWEGLFGGVAFAAIAGYLLVTLLPEQLSLIRPRWILLLGVLIAATSVVGDLAESVVKRDARVKDSGRLIPGIGGALDLIDSILFTAPILFLWLQFVHLT